MLGFMVVWAKLLLIAGLTSSMVSALGMGFQG